MATGIAKSPEPLYLSSDMAEAWRAWIEEFEIFLVANEHGGHRWLQTFALEGASGDECQKYGAN